MCTPTVTNSSCQYTIGPDSKSGNNSVFVKCLSDEPGTDTVRLLMKASFFNNCSGRLHSDAICSSHFFHLRMGMVPRERAISVVNQFGISGDRALKNLDQIHAAYNISRISEQQTSDIQRLKTMLVYARTEQFDEQAAALLSDKALFDAKDELLALQKKTCSYIQNAFIPQLLFKLSNSSQKPYSAIDTGHWSAIPMEMSQEGQRRWKEDLEGKTSFLPFEKFEHLHPYMTKQQQQELDEILKRRTV